MPRRKSGQKVRADERKSALDMSGQSCFDHPLSCCNSLWLAHGTYDLDAHQAIPREAVPYCRTRFVRKGLFQNGLIRRKLGRYGNFSVNCPREAFS